MIHGAGHSSGECNFLGEFLTKYSEYHPTKDQGGDPIPRKMLQKKQENHTITNNVADELRIVGSKKVSAVNHEAPGFLESEYDEKDLYQVENMSLYETKEIIE